MTRFLRENRLFNNRMGATALEFALVAPILFILLFAAIEVTYIMLVNGILESAVRYSSRAGVTGYTPSGVSRDDYVKSVVQSNLVVLNPSSLQFKTLIYDDFANIGDPEPYTDSNHNSVYNLGEPYTDVNGNNQWDSDMGAAGSGGPGAIVVYKVTYPWHIVTPMLSSFFPVDANGDFNITASMVVRNEPYD